jgi:type IV secretion system protein VirB5
MLATIASFISEARMVSPDATLQRQGIFRVYSMLHEGDPATQKMHEWFNATKESSPFERAATEAVSVEIISVIPQTSETWQVDWRETVRDRQGAVKGRHVMRALVTVYVSPPTSATTDEQMRNNPLGIYVRDFNWARQN